MLGTALSSKPKCGEYDLQPRKNWGNWNLSFLPTPHQSILKKACTQKNVGSGDWFSAGEKLETFEFRSASEFMWSFWMQVDIVAANFRPRFRKPRIHSSWFVSRCGGALKRETTMKLENNMILDISHMRDDVNVNEGIQVDLYWWFKWSIHLCAGFALKVSVVPKIRLGPHQNSFWMVGSWYRSQRVKRPTLRCWKKFNNSRDKTWYILLETNRSPPKALLKMIFLFQRWDMCSFPGRCFFPNEQSTESLCFFVIVFDFPIQAFFGQKIATFAAIGRFLNHY